MGWIIENKRLWRGLLLGLLFMALMGPWVFDIIHVPAEYPCSAAWVRLVGDYCGEPRSGIWILGEMIGMMTGLVTGLFALSDVLPGLLFVISIFLPFVSTAVMLLSGGQRQWVGLHSLAIILAVGAILLSGLFSFPRLSWMIWGVWLYVVSAVGALVLEAVNLMIKRKTISR
jgi:hypothetical protein